MSSDLGSTLRISEIFFSLQGESSRIGLPTVFVRLTGCPLRCEYCDSAHAFTGGKSMSVQEVLDAVAKFDPHYVCVTGGEPLAQKHSLTLLRALSDAGYAVSLETSGALDVSGVDARVMKVLDIKTPGSGEESKNLWENLQYLSGKDEIKFVLCNEADYQWAKQVLSDRDLARRCEVTFSPVHDDLTARDLAEWILRDHLPVRMQVQLHKILWGNEVGR
ncbi:MAG: 7-carboxy-7-deazaguanine synthase QueE [Gammaproteobacteria bacterium]|nr:7-carboxy-7-deazaguanine synthase QueE [Gammaproteobacteria bacterium]MBU1625483.1 7-carboxy-7-deazaguanine synthase QueE [Gammaproteobacteria bacterium]MBU1980743.1 7-carboxy-7-deazaguanine synthase QueE [Gammaproteobacteria bacterium]